MKRVHSRFLPVALSCCLAGMVSPAYSDPVDFNSLIAENYPATDGFAEPAWEIVDSSTARENGNSWITVLAGTEDVTNKIITGTIIPGGDDDITGLVLGYDTGDVTNPNADFLLIDWKGVTQGFNFSDPEGGAEFHNLTPSATAEAGIALSRVTGIPTADELWGHETFPENPDGGVEELARGLVSGSQPYDRSGGGHDFVIVYESDRVSVRVDGNLEFEVEGSFPSGGLGMYESHQSPGSTYTNFSIDPIPAAGDFNGDGAVDAGDFDILASNFLSGTTFAEGDSNFDGQVDHFDFVEFVAAFEGAAAGAAVPEPATWALALFGIVAACLARKWTSRGR